MLCCGVTRTKFMDSLCSCLLLILVLEIAMLVQPVGALPLTIHWSFRKEETYAGKVTIAFLTEWMPCLFSMEFSEGKPIRLSHFENQTLDVIFFL